MEIYHGHKGFKSHRPVVTIGMFDGVHRGHRYLLDSVVSRAEQMGGESVVITFEPHPRIVLSDDNSLRFLTSIDEKCRLIEEAGIDKLIILPFSISLSRLPACDFVRIYLVEVIGVEHIVLGFDHHFGYRGYGKTITITECAKRYGFGVERLNGLKEGDEIISSTVIRELVKEGSLDAANELLGYSYLLKGKVIEGRKIGRVLGYPTANIAPAYDYKLIPGDGVYAVETILDQRVYKAMLYIGSRPTLQPETPERTIEVNIFDFDKDIYGTDIMVRFRYRLRGDRKFGTREELQAQIEKDKIESLRLLAD